MTSGGLVRVTSTQAPELGIPWDIFSLDIISPPPPPLAPPPPLPPPGMPWPPSSPFMPSVPMATVSDSNLATSTASGSGVNSRSWASQWNPGVILDEVIPDPPRVVRDLPTLFILLDLCGKGGGPATTNTVGAGGGKLAAWELWSFARRWGSQRLRWRVAGVWVMVRVRKVFLEGLEAEGGFGVATGVSALVSRWIGSLVVVVVVVVVRSRSQDMKLLELGREGSLADMLFNGLAPMSDYIATCSYGKAQFDQYNTRIVNIALPCNGTGHATKMPWNSSSCSRDNLFNWMYEAEYYIDNVLKPKDWNHRRYRHHVIITPPNMPQWAGSECNWSGMGSIGMAQGTWSYAWISGDSWKTKQVYLHELGHNYNLMHAATLESGDPESCSHCDWSSAMGYCCDTRCLSAPHNFQLGWAKPASTVNSSKLVAGNTLAFELPSQILSDANYLKVTTDWLCNTSVSESVVLSYGGSEFYNPANATFLLSYRMEFNEFDEVAPGFAGGTNVYLFSVRRREGACGGAASMSVCENGWVTLGVLEWSGQREVSSQMEAKDSVHLALLSESSPSWTDPSGTLVVRQVATSSLAAVVTVCRPDGNSEATYEQCTDFWDNDCDGLVGLISRRLFQARLHQPPNKERSVLRHRRDTPGEYKMHPALLCLYSVNNGYYCGTTA
ncbi:hypothetical protein VOLCADRAFT_103856 [Volvox carteri f. nagariensis]|uniref:Peptidase M11 gametolysin domain-containing protein n=1 Tax=Volvox carteri f. nagariensis TaxID=3068 RepID=D8TPN9_VOLCA|nr:uncharacterized protein VOLCADRAFT_103856 [Volvox carteri f. nagariensis]EFJ50649.1 hypothetical protein VOLCADRAFT_103856 [Volvox carteri f. nagariensis]|eukprot:XP_002948242.1 hypothetical protein VOLCADRAFT_103856 [Volvox carteri f. nagariensis]